MTPGSFFEVKPDPPIEGKELEVTHTGPAKEVFWQVDGKEPTKVEPDEDGKFTIDPVPSGTCLLLSDNLGQPGYLNRKIVSSG